MSCGNDTIVLNKNSLVFDMWNENDFEKLVDRSNNTYLSKILTTPTHKQIPTVPINGGINNGGINNRRYLAARNIPIKNLIRVLASNIHKR
jgi:hypothetical protein